MKKKLILIDSERFGGGDGKAINRHSVRLYEDEDGNRYSLDKTLDGVPPFYRLVGPFQANYRGILPITKVKGAEYWGGGLSWQKAKQKMLETLGATIE